MRARQCGQEVRFIFAMAAAGLGCLAFGTLVSPSPRFIWNVTASAPVGLYRLIPEIDLHKADLVLVRTPESVRELADRRGYLPRTVPMVKRIVALVGGHICAQGREIFIDGKLVAIRLKSDRAGRPLPAWTGCRMLRTDEIFLLMKDVPDSFDGRYFGPVEASSIIGRLIPVWTR
jgi:conjugative transfer signal peptidase TraF